MVSKNDITGDSIQTKGTSENYRNNYDLIFRKKQQVETVESDKVEEKSIQTNSEHRE